MPKFLDFKAAECRDCYKCLKECPVKAIKIENHQAKIIEERCILCGKCTLICPQNAKKVHSELENVKELIRNNKVIASVAPSFISSFNVASFEDINTALQKLGFEYAEETARGAQLVVNEYERLLKEKKYNNFITSCCPAINRMITTYYPNAIEYLAKVDSPIIAHAKLLKNEHPDCKIVFIGPCIAKKRECNESGLIDGVLTFEEIVKLLDEYDISIEENKIDKDKIEENKIDVGKKVNEVNNTTEINKEVSWNKSRVFPISRGIIKSFNNLPDGYEYIAVDGVQKCKEVLEEIDNLENVFLELNACPSACVNGPCSLNKESTAITSNARVRKYVNDNVSVLEQDYSVENYNDIQNIDISCEHKKSKYSDITPSEEQIREVLAKTGKNKPEDELNCGACGYSSCREKAWAVINGYADIEMCLPYMRERAENISYEVIKHSPDGIIVIDNEFKVIDINAKACSLLGVSSAMAKESYIFDCIDENESFLIAISEKRNMYRKQIKISNTNTYVELSINYMEDHDMIFAIMKDITEKVSFDEQLNKVKLETMAITDKVIKKQMRVAQEIASLLGETTAETKVALVNLKKTLQNNEEKGEK